MPCLSISLMSKMQLNFCQLAEPNFVYQSNLSIMISFAVIEYDCYREVGLYSSLFFPNFCYLYTFCTFIWNNVFIFMLVISCTVLLKRKKYTCSVHECCNFFKKKNGYLWRNRDDNWIKRKKINIPLNYRICPFIQRVYML